MFEIEQGVPIPPRGSGRSVAKYPFRHLKIGESFFVPCGDAQEAARIRQSIANCTPIHRPARFTVRRVEGGVRAWRIQ